MDACTNGQTMTSVASLRRSIERACASSTATIVGFATLGIGGLFGHNFAHGREKTIDEKTVLTAYVGGNVHVRSSQRAASDPLYDK